MYYLLFICTGFTAGILLILIKSANFKIKKSLSLSLSILFIIAFVIGAKLSSIIRDFDYYILNPKQILSFGGFGFYGGFIFGILVIFIICRLKRINFLNYADLGSYGLSIGESIGRIGCFWTGCCYGKITDVPWGIIPSPSMPAFKHFGGLSVHPTQLYYSLLNFLLFLFLLGLRQRFRGFIFLNYLMLHSVIRLVVDVFRADTPYFLVNLSCSWFISLILFVISVASLVRLGVK